MSTSLSPFYIPTAVSTSSPSLTDIHAGPGVNEVSRLGTPFSITTNCGNKFESSLWNKVMSILRIKLIKTASYNPQSNGLAVRFHGQLKVAGRCNTRQQRKDHDPDTSPSLHTDVPQRRPRPLLCGTPVRHHSPPTR